MPNAESNAQVVTKILNTLEGHPNFVKANRIIDELDVRAGKIKRKTTPQSKPAGNPGLHLADRSA